LHSLAALYARLRDFEQGEQFARQAVSILDRLAAEHPDVVEFRHHQAWAVYILGKALTHPMRPAEAEAAFQRAAALYEELISRFPYNADYFYELPKCYVVLSKLQWSRGATREADQTIQRLLALPDRIPPGTTVPAEVFYDAAWALAAMPDPQQRNATKAVELGTRAVELAPRSWSSWNTLGVAQYRAGQWQAAIDAFSHATDLPKFSSDWFFLAMAHWQLGHKDEAGEWYEKAVDWMDKNRPMDAELQDFRKEAGALLGIAEVPPSVGMEPRGEAKANAERSAPPPSPTTDKGQRTTDQ